MIFIYSCIFIAIFSYTAIWLWYIKAYMQYDFGSYYKEKYKNVLSDEQKDFVCENYLNEKNTRCSTIMKMILIAGPFAWIVLIVTCIVGKILKYIDKDYEKTGTDIL